MNFVVLFLLIAFSCYLVLSIIFVKCAQEALNKIPNPVLRNNGKRKHLKHAAVLVFSQLVGIANIVVIRLAVWLGFKNVFVLAWSFLSLCNAIITESIAFALAINSKEVGIRVRRSLPRCFQRIRQVAPAERIATVSMVHVSAAVRKPELSPVA